MSRLENIRDSVKSTEEEAKRFFHGEQWRELLVFSFFVLLAFGFWLLQSLQQEYEMELNFPVRYRNVPADIAFDNPLPEQVKVKVKDRGSVLLNYTFRRSFAPISIAVYKDKSQKDGVLRVTRKQLETDIQKQLISTTLLEGFEPQQIDIRYSKRASKEVPVIFEGAVRPVAGFQLAGEIRISPLRVTAYATSALLDTLKEAQTVYAEIADVNMETTHTLRLRPIEGVSFEPPEVSVTIPVEEYTEKTLDVPVVCDGVPSHYTVRLFPSTVKVTCSVPLSRFTTLSEKLFEIHIPYSSLAQNALGTLPVKLTKQPEWVRIVTLSPDQVEFLLEQNNRL